MTTEYRQLTSEELVRLSELKDMRTKSQKRAFNMLPASMRLVAEQDAPLAFWKHAAFFPDILLREQRICIEIDGATHRTRVRQDMHRDSVLAEHVYNTSRIKNMDTKVNVVFWQRLLEGLDNIYSSERSEAICKMKKELESLIAEEIRKWTMLE
jgi:hypothetical protein